MEGQPSEPHHQDKPCDTCGAVGMKHTIVTCSKCCIAREHVYCMKVYTKIIPRIWVCEECLWRDNIVSPNSVREDEFLDSRNIAHTAAPSRVIVDLQGQFHHKKPKAFETGKVKFLPYAEAQRLSSGAQGKKYHEFNYSMTAMQSKNVNPSLKHPGNEISRQSLGAQGKQSQESNNSRKAMPAKNVIPEFPLPRVKEHPGFKLPVADISRLTSGAQEKEPHESNNSRTAMPAKNVIPNFSLPRVNANPSSQLPSHGGAQIIRMIDQKTAKKSEKSKEKYGDKKRPVAAFMPAKEAEISKPKNKEVKTPNANADYARNEALYGSSTPLCSIAISTEKCSDKKRPKEAEILKPKTKEVKTPNSNSDYSRNEVSYGSSTPMCSIPISPEKCGDKKWPRAAFMPAKEVKTPNANANADYARNEALYASSTPMCLIPISTEKCGDKKQPGAAFMPAKEAEISKPKTKGVETPNANAGYTRNEVLYGSSSTRMCSLPISTGQTLHAVAGNNCSFEERDLLNILPKLERYLPSLEATWNECLLESFDSMLVATQPKSLSCSGEFLFSDTATPGECYGGFVAHPPCKIHYKAFEFAQKFPNDLQVKLLPRCPHWEELFGDRTPDFRDIALYFFPTDNTERSKHYYSSLFDFLEGKNLVMRSYVAGVELLISTSKQLDVDSQKIIARSSTKNFLWGVFRRAKADEILHKVDEELLPSLVSPMEYACDGHADEGVDMDVDMEGGNAMDKVDVPPGYEKISMLKSRITGEKSGLVDGGVRNHKEVEKIGFRGVSEQPQRSPIAFKLTRSEKPRQKPACDNPLSGNHSRKRERERERKELKMKAVCDEHNDVSIL